MVFKHWLMADAAAGQGIDSIDDGIEWTRVIPFIGMHLMCFAVIWVGVSPVAVLVAVLAYLVRMFAITGFYHRYFSHRAYRTSRVFQFLLAVATQDAGR